MSVLEQLEQEKITALSELESAQTEAELEAWRLVHLGKSSPVMQAFSALGSASKEERPLIGKSANAVKVALESAYAAKNETMRQLALAQAVEKERLDVTLPGRALRRGRLHPLNQTLREICRVFGDMGFQVYRSPEVETDDYNFTFLNMPPYHPARDMWDTFYTEKEGVCCARTPLRVRFTSCANAPRKPSAPFYRARPCATSSSRRALKLNLCRWRCWWSAEASLSRT
jgi:Phenylalanyl-tRNA synthetase alpha subunit